MAAKNIKRILTLFSPKCNAEGVAAARRAARANKKGAALRRPLQRDDKPRFARFAPPTATEPPGGKARKSVA